MKKAVMALLVIVWLLCPFLNDCVHAEGEGIILRNRRIIQTVFDEHYPGITPSIKEHFVISYEGILVRSDYERIYVVDLQYEDVQNIVVTYHLSSEGDVLFHSSIKLYDVLELLQASPVSKKEAVSIAYSCYNDIINQPDLNNRKEAFIYAYGPNSLEQDYLSAAIQFITDDNSFENPQWYISLNYSFYGRNVTWLSLRIDSVSGEYSVLYNDIYNDDVILFSDID